MEVTIKPIAEEHIVGYHSVLSIVSEERRYLGFDKAPPFDGTCEFVRGNIADGIPQFVALVDGEVVGWCDISLSRRPVFKHSGSLGMGIHPDFRGQGIGKKLITTTIEAAQRKGVTRVELEVFASNNRAIALYEKIGFKREGLKQRFARFDERYEDGVIMALLLNGDLSLWSN